MMDHDQAHPLLPAYLDAELSPAESLALERHLAGCEACRAEYERQQAVSAMIRGADLRYDAPDDLAHAIRAALPLCGARQRAPRKPARTKRSFLPWFAGWVPAGMVGGGALALGAAAAMYLALPSPTQRLTEELVESHVRSLQMDHSIDVLSTDRHTVKPWFNGKLDFAPPVVDLKAQGYPLTGGRLDYLNGRAVAVLIYRYRLHPIDLYLWPDGTDTAAPADASLKGYRIAHWRMDGMNYWAVTDAGQAELDGFVQALRANAGT